MKIVLDSNDYVVGYATVGDMFGSIDISDDNIPGDFEIEFESYKYVNGNLTFDADKKEEIARTRERESQTRDPITDLQLALAEIYEMIAGGLT